MYYYDIHTHKAIVSSEEVAIINRIIGEREGMVSPDTYLSYGIHPWYIHNIEEQQEKLRQAVQKPSVVAIGEAGLDKLAQTDFRLQEKVFTDQAFLAEESGKPLIIHCVKAWAELIAVKKNVKPEMPWVIHGFRGSVELADQLIKQGFYLSFGAHFNSQAARVAWPEHLLAETDDSEVGIRAVYNQLADSLEISIETFASRLAETVNSIFLLD